MQMQRTVPQSPVAETLGPAEVATEREGKSIEVPFASR